MSAFERVLTLPHQRHQHEEEVVNEGLNLALVTGSWRRSLG